MSRGCHVKSNRLIWLYLGPAAGEVLEQSSALRGVLAIQVPLPAARGQSETLPAR
jgi:hypothetical protein